jgi:RNA polymerase sigma-70 factor (ECF subfamily)
LIRRAREGDPAAFEHIVAAYRDRMYRWAVVQMGEVDDAEDATQEALVRLHRGLRRYEGRAGFESWLYAVVRSAVADIRRKKARRLEMRNRYSFLGGRDAVADPAPVLERLDRRRLADRVAFFLRSLPARQREAMDLVDLQGVAPADAAARLGIADATLRTHLFRARRSLRTRLLSEEGDSEEG